ncbi:hypothetical protein UFOVP124_24 [uncultured Caudovirales phage]|uniref:Uncharacterized protein n=1 Tax=uncultured Caudovirales phage TaxID=2100421 RepID=A0A6J5LBH6_9CAUD|nr:hypothetical protein UFOVP124_24 [uncultured Caudovirales phage]
MDPDLIQTAGAPAPANVAPAAPAPGQYVPTPNMAAQAAAYGQQFQPPPGYQPPPPPVAPPPAPAAPSPVQVAPEELARLYNVQKQYEEFQRNQADAARQAEAARLMAEAEKGKVQEAFQEFQRKATAEAEQLRNTLQAGELGRVVAEAVAGITFASDEARKDAMLVLRSQVTASIDPTTGSVLVRDLSGRPAIEALREMATSPRFAHYRAPSTTGGTAGQGYQARPMPPAGPAYQQNSHADIVNQVRAARGLPPLDPAAMGTQGPAASMPPANASPSGLVWRG